MTSTPAPPPAGSWVRRWLSAPATVSTWQQQAIQSAGGAQAPSGQVVAELPFGFCRYLSSNAHEKNAVGAMSASRIRYRQRPPGYRPTGRARLHQLRNRVDHHEPLLRINVTNHFGDLRQIASLLDPELDQYLEATTTITHWINRRP